MGQQCQHIGRWVETLQSSKSTRVKPTGREQMEGRARGMWEAWISRASIVARRQPDLDGIKEARGVFHEVGEDELEAAAIELGQHI
eukprot:5680687-Pyramimonas_sp.AAC.1